MPKVAIIGRPNVGKSTLFNRLAGRQLAIVDDTPGVTRDRREAETTFKSGGGAYDLTLVDTAGFEETHDDSLQARMRHQTELAIQEADLVLFVFDARAGVVPHDESFADIVRKSAKPVILLANKAEKGADESAILEGHLLGLGDPWGVSSAHGIGVRELKQQIVARLFSVEEEEEDFDALFMDEDELPEIEDENKPLQLAIVGRPNAGKSTLINKLIGEDRLLTGPEAGITRDAISVPWAYKGQEIKLIDTAGMRKKAKVNEKLESMSVDDTLRSIQFAEIVVLMVDATQTLKNGLDKQDLQIADHVVKEGRCLVLALNKWDAVSEKNDVRAEVEYRLGLSLPQVKGIPLVSISGQKGRNLDKLLDQVLTQYEIWNRRVGTSALNRWIEGMLADHAPPMVKGRRLKVRYVTQSNTRPPTFALFCNMAKEFPSDYKRYLMNGLRETFELHGVPIRLMIRGGKNPFEGKKD